MLKFTKLRWKNFLSTGDKFTEIDFTAARTTLVVGGNGAGKSTMLDALSYALFGKAHRKINTPQLVNSVNNKGMLCEVEFTVAGADFKVVRGLKPQIFEIWKNGKSMNQEADARAYQKFLEQNIIKLNHKSFHQIVVLGSSSFVPFMQLPAQHRRDIIEDLLDINVFSKMNLIIREKTSMLKEIIKDNEYKININEKSIETQSKYICNMNAMNEEELAEKKDQISATQKDIDKLNEKNVELSEYLEKWMDTTNTQSEKVQGEYNKLVSYENQFKNKVVDVVKSSKFYEENSSCPTCTQKIEEHVRETKLKDARAQARELQSAMDKAKVERIDRESVLADLNKKYEELRGKQSSINANNQEIRTLHKNIDTLNKSINRLINRESDLEKAKADLLEMRDERDQLKDKKYEFSSQLAYNSVIIEMLKDTGIKTKIIRQFLPIINKFINQYLQVLDFFVHFHLDESFQETIRSRHRDAFSYSSFSEGEKQRIDLALLFSWRMIAKMKNSVSTNLLILDETFDSSLDHEGVDNLMKILYTLDDDTNIFVISHKGEILEGKFESRIEFVKDKNFSKISK